MRKLMPAILHAMAQCRPHRPDSPTIALSDDAMAQLDYDFAAEQRDAHRMRRRRHAQA